MTNKTTFKDIETLTEAKDKIEQFVDYLLNKNNLLHIKKIYWGIL